ncbi:MAG: polyhydroxyalkanoate granule-associated phasin [Casimicrobiaceae bacterium]
MKRDSRSAFGNPFLVWTDLAWQFGEMWVASAQVVTHRTSRMAAAGPLPSARDCEEFALMSREKVEAAAESASAVATQMMAMYGKFGARAVRHMMSGTAAFMALAASRTVGQSIARQAALARTFSQSLQMASEMSESGAHLARHSLHPVHSRATANAKRLSRR